MGRHRLLEPPALPPPDTTVTELVEAALDRPIEHAPLESAILPGQRVVVIASDHTRADPVDLLVHALVRRLPPVELTVAIATGTHGPCPRGATAFRALPAGTQVVNFDCDQTAQLRLLGTSRAGTPFRVHRCVADADWVLATGCIRPHYFAGYGGGSKAIFPGLGGRAEVRQNHRLKSLPGAQVGNIESNPCRLDVEELLEHLPGKAFLLNLVMDAHKRARAAVAGDVRTAFRQGAAICRPLHTVQAETSKLIVASAAPPVSSSLYQASKIVAAVAPLLEDDGTVVVAADCAEGVGGVAVVNQAIYELGIKPRLPSRHRIVLVSSLEPAVVETTYCEPASSVEAVLERNPNWVPLVVPHADCLILEQVSQ